MQKIGTNGDGIYALATPDVKQKEEALQLNYN